MVNWRTPIYRELSRKLTDVLGAKTAGEFAKVGIVTVDDLVRHVPRRYVAGTEMSDFSNVRLGEDAALIAQVLSSQLLAGRVAATIADGQGRQLSLTFFAQKPGVLHTWHNLLQPGRRGIFVGKVGEFNGILQLTNPDFVMLDGVRTGGGRTRRESEKQRLGRESREAMSRTVQRATMIGLYPATKRLPTWAIAESIELVLPGLTGDTLPAWVVEEAGVLPFENALTAVHEPTSQAQAEVGIERLRFDEAFGIQLAMAARRRDQAKEPAIPRARRKGGLVDAFDAQLPFTLTDGQSEICETIFTDLAASQPMNRLLQGEVGSGKTVIALRAMLNVVDNGGQAVLLAPTEVLAKQHYQSICGLLGPLAHAGQLDAPEQATSVALLTGTLSAAAKRQAQASIAAGEAGIVVGTHALLSDPVEFKDLGLVVIDEQHRFGVEQRAALAAKAAQRPHSLFLTATPIPRSIAMTVFGDLEVSELRELPRGRKPIQTVFVNTLRHSTWVDRAWERIREEVAAGRQAFVVCPAISGKQLEGGGKSSGNAELAAVEDLAPKLASGPLRGLKIGMVHGSQAVAERDDTMAAFTSGEVDVLIATTVIEVGVDVPNASMMVVLDADRFGLSQLHQLRGRVGRGDTGGLCLLLAAVTDDAIAQQRLEALASTQDGFALADLDLELRREGDVLGDAQSGGGTLKLLRALDHADLIDQAKALAQRVIEDTRAESEPLLADLMTKAELMAAGEWMEKS